MGNKGPGLERGSVTHKRKFPGNDILQPMKLHHTPHLTRGFGVLGVMVGYLATVLVVGAQEKPHLTVTCPGGMPGLPVISGIERTTNGVAVSWDGPSGYYQLYQALGLGQPWQKIGGLNLSRKATITTLYNNAFFKVAGPQPRYAGSQACLECHENIHTTEMDTRHARALDTLKAAHQDKNPACLPCHTVGHGLPTGFVSELTTPHLAGVQCENCHGPAGNHAANEMDLTARPRVELAGQVCGGCHTGSHHPTYDEWKSSGHFAVVEDMNPSGRINGCGRCHSGSSRLALLKGEDPSVTVTNDANVGITCVVCHDPHQKHTWTNVLTGLTYTNQLRNPLSSTNDYSLGTADVFAAKYDSSVNICAQCHNQRGASWSSSSRPPHHSPQYNVLLGTIGELDPSMTRWRATHATGIEKQCVSCHMAGEEYVSEAQPAMTGHNFKVESFVSCTQCHPLPELLTQFTMTSIDLQIQQLKGYLDFWAATKAPLALRTKYGARAWEYTTPGELSSGGAGPSSSEQAQIPDNIKKARFNLYIVKYDGSYGVHNGPHAIALLASARNWIATELNK